MRKMPLLFLALSAGCLAQTVRPIIVIGFPPELKRYLALSDDQVTKISTLNSQLTSFRSAKYERQLQVQSEITEWTAKETLDSAALGIRYAELEAIRRELNDQQKKTVGQIQVLLTVEQKTKLAVLEQALSLYSTACSGVSQNLLSPPPDQSFRPAPFSYTGIFLGTLTSPCGGLPTIPDFTVVPVLSPAP